jgi:hypothetical protein
MNRQEQIHQFSLAAHRLVVSRLREHPEHLLEAAQVIQRWRQQSGGHAHCGPYWNEWEQLLSQGVDAVEHAACVATDHAAVLRSVSPLGRFISASERKQLLCDARSGSA